MIFKRVWRSTDQSILYQIASCLFSLAWSSIFGGFRVVFFFGDGHGVGYSCAHPLFDFLQPSIEHMLGSFWVNIAAVNRR